MNCCKPEKMGTQEFGKMLKRILILEEGRIPAKEGRGWKIERLKGRITSKKYERLREEFEIGGVVAQKKLWNIAKKIIL